MLQIAQNIIRSQFNHQAFPHDFNAYYKISQRKLVENNCAPFFIKNLQSGSVLNADKSTIMRNKKQLVKHETYFLHSNLSDCLKRVFMKKCDICARTNF